MILTGREYWVLFPGQNICSSRSLVVLLAPNNSIFMSSIWILGSLTSLGSPFTEGEKCLWFFLYCDYTLIHTLSPQNSSYHNSLFSAAILVLSEWIRYQYSISLSCRNASITKTEAEESASSIPPSHRK